MLNVDFGDTHGYMFFMQYANPPDYLIVIGVVGWGLWLATLLLHVVIRSVIALRQRSAN